MEGEEKRGARGEQKRKERTKREEVEVEFFLSFFLSSAVPFLIPSFFLSFSLNQSIHTHPIVVMKLLVNESSEKRSRRQDLPTPVSPMMMYLKR